MPPQQELRYCHMMGQPVSLLRWFCVREVAALLHEGVGPFMPHMGWGVGTCCIPHSAECGAEQHNPRLWQSAAWAEG